MDMRLEFVPLPVADPGSHQLVPRVQTGVVAHRQRAPDLEQTPARGRTWRA